MAITLAIEEESFATLGVKLKVIGVGGAGSNAVNSMITGAELTTVNFIVANTDAQALALSPAPIKIQLGKKITKGLGAGSNPEVGRRAAEEDLDSIIEYLKDTDILFLTAGLGGGTGSGSIPVIAHTAKELGILSVAVVTKPFAFEGKRRAKLAEEALKNLAGCVDTLIVVPNQRLLEIADPKISMLNAFSLSNDILKQAIKGISDIITETGLVNVDFADVRSIMKDTGMAIMGTGRASGADRARQATMRAINSPLLENTSIHGARGVLINITGNENLELQEINDAASLIYDMVNPEANIILGSVIDKNMDNEIAVTVIATGLTTAIQDVTTASTQIKTESINAATFAPEKPTMQEIHIVEKPKIYTEMQAIPTLPPQQTATHHTEPSIQVAAPTALALEEEFDMNDLDTPTFLRKKAEEQQNNAQLKSSMDSNQDPA